MIFLFLRHKEREKKANTSLFMYHASTIFTISGGSVLCRSVETCGRRSWIARRTNRCGVWSRKTVRMMMVRTRTTRSTGHRYPTEAVQAGKAGRLSKGCCRWRRRWRGHRRWRRVIRVQGHVGFGLCRKKWSLLDRRGFCQWMLEFNRWTGIGKKW